MRNGRGNWAPAVGLTVLLLIADAVSCTGGKDPVEQPAAAAPAPSSATPPEIRPPAIPELPPEKLPPRTAAPPDPAVEQFVRETVSVRIDEEVKPKDREAYRPELRVLENYVAEYFRRAGFPIVPPADAMYIVDGQFHSQFHGVKQIQEVPFAHTYAGRLLVTVKRKADGAEVERIEIPEHLTDGVLLSDKPEEEIPVLEMRRRLAQIVWQRVFHDGSTLGNPKIPALIASLASDDLENEAPVQGSAVVDDLVKLRFQSVPYLLEALSDERTVLVNAPYPGLGPGNSDKLRVYHLADKALEEIFQKVSRLSLETPDPQRFSVIRGWENEWARFCPPFRGSPSRALKASTAAARAQNKAALPPSAPQSPSKSKSE